MKLAPVNQELTVIEDGYEFKVEIKTTTNGKGKEVIVSPPLNTTSFIESELESLEVPDYVGEAYTRKRVHNTIIKMLNEDVEI